MATAIKPPGSVAIIGGGCAGLAAAAELVQRGVPTTLFEAAPTLGGRARGVDWHGHALDNGQHILLGAYHETLRLLRLAGVDIEAQLLRLPLQLTQYTLADDSEPAFSLHAWAALPAPLHILWGLITARGLDLVDRIAALRLMLKLRLTRFRLRRDEPLQHWLICQKQPEKLIRLLWEPLCLAALNTPIQTASTQVFLHVLRDSFAQRRGDSDLLLPRCNLDALIAEPLAHFITRTSGRITTRARVSALIQGASGFELTINGKTEIFEQVIIATAPAHAAALLPDHPQLQPTQSTMAALGYQPIYTVYVHYPRAITLPLPMTGVIGGLGQWIIDRGALAGQPGLIAVVISASGPHQSMSHEALASTIVAELDTLFPDWPSPDWHKVIAEKRATFHCAPNMMRPAHATALPGLYLAGDYTAGDYPATIEGAVRSGVQCAAQLLANRETTV